MPRLSILIPYLGNRDSLENTLASVLQNHPAEAEVIVALGCDYDDPYHIDEEVRFVRAGAKGGLIETVNRGFHACQAPIVHLLCCGATVSEGWTEPALAHFHDHRVASVAPLIVEADQPDRIWAAGLDYDPGGARRLRGEGQNVEGLGALAATSLGPTWVAGFYTRALAQHPGGPFDPRMGWAADLDLALRLRGAGYATVFEPTSIVQQSVLAESETGLTAARQTERLFWRHAAERGWASSSVLHAKLVAGEFIRSLPRPRALTQLAGRALACCEFGASRRHRLLFALPRPAAEEAGVNTAGYRLDGPHADRGIRAGEPAPRPGRRNPPLSDRRP